MIELVIAAAKEMLDTLVIDETETSIKFETGKFIELGYTFDDLSVQMLIGLFLSTKDAKSDIRVLQVAGYLASCLQDIEVAYGSKH